MSQLNDEERTIRAKPLGVCSSAYDNDFDDVEVLLVRKSDFDWLVERNRSLRALVDQNATKAGQ